MQLISVWCPYCLCHHTHGIDAAMPSWAITHRPGGRRPFDQIGNQKWHRWPWSGTIYLCHASTLYMGLSGLWHNVTEYTKFFVYRE